MVRLKDVNSSTQDVPPSVFQFQNGSIKRFMSLVKESHGSVFQFQNGSIKSCRDIWQSSDGALFQFQNGSIKRWHVRWHWQCTLMVSIPKWFD